MSINSIRPENLPPATSPEDDLLELLRSVPDQHSSITQKTAALAKTLYAVLSSDPASKFQLEEKDPVKNEYNALRVDEKGMAIAVQENGPHVLERSKLTNELKAYLNPFLEALP